MRLLLVTHSYLPDTTPPAKRWKGFITALRKDGWEVDVLAPAAKTATDHERGTEFGPAGERIYRTPGIRFLPDTRLGRLAGTVIEAGLTIPQGLRPQRPDVVVATVPALPTLFSGRLIAWLRGAAFVIDMRDAWPDLLNDAGIRPAVVSGLAQRAITAVQKTADSVLTVTEGFARKLASRGIGPVHVVPNSFEATGQSRPSTREREAGELNVLYLGNHGESQNLELLIQAAALARDANPKISVRLVGDGTQKPQLAELNEQLGEPVQMLDPIPEAEVDGQYRWADTCVVTLRPDWPSFDYTVPSKTYELLATGKHITGILKGESAAILEQAGHDAALPADAHQIAKSWLDLAQNPDSTQINEASIQWSAEHLSPQTQQAKLVRAINTVVDYMGKMPRLIA